MPEFYWGLVFAGDRVRLMRDNASLTRPAWIEADLGAMFRDEMFADFTAWWLLTHATRFGAEGAAASDCALEQWREEGLKQGTAARERLREGVEEALHQLGQGLVEANPDIRRRIIENQLSLTALFEELLRTVYRLIFLAVAEDRDLLHPRNVSQPARALYAENYSFSFWRERSRRRVARDHHYDAWECMKIALASLEHGETSLGLPALGGLFARNGTLTLNDARIPNRCFLEALFNLGFIRVEGSLHRINWRDMKTEEFGSIYESLLEIRPSLAPNGEFVLDSGTKGNARKTSGSYYTPDSLVEALLDTALDPLLERAEANSETPEDKVRAILDLRVIDPACGSGHFLLGAARRMADRVALWRNSDAGKDEKQAALRDVVSRCIHGTDRNPMAVELAKVALWIESVSPGQPLGFLDANIRCGDALLGVFDLGVLEEGIPDAAYKPLTGDSKEAAKYYARLNKDEKKGQGQLDFRGGGGAMPPRKLAANLATIKRMPEDTVAQVEEKKRRFDAWRHDPSRYATRVACDLYMAAFLLRKSKLPDTRGRDIVPTTADIRRKLAGGTNYGPMEAAAIEIAEVAHALHWPLAFPDIMVERGGFDLVLGNPPWDRIKLQEHEFFAARSPEIAGAPNKAARNQMIKQLADAPDGSPENRLLEEFMEAKRLTEATSEFSRCPGDEGGRFELTGRGDVNTYALFAELSAKLIRERGRTGIIVPTGIATDANNQWFFRWLIRERKLISLFSFYEIRLVFTATDDRNSFCLLTLGDDQPRPEFVFSILNVDMISDEDRRFALSEEEIQAINPTTGTAAIFRSKADAELTAAIYRRVPPLVHDDVGRHGNPWGAFYLRLVDYGDHATELWSRERAAGAGYSFDGNTAHLGRCKLLPVYESKYIHMFNHRFSSTNEDTEPVSAEMGEQPKQEIMPRYWVSDDFLENLMRKYDFDRQWLLAYRDITNSSAARTTISVAIPRMPASRNLPILGFDDSKPGHVLLGNLNSIILDFAARQKVGGTHLTFTILKQLPILPPAAYLHVASPSCPSVLIRCQ
jgi:hypothetical protein